MIVNINGLQDQLTQLYRERKFEELLQSVQGLFMHLLHMPELKGQALYEPVSDAILRFFAENHFGQRRRAPRQDTILHIATEVYELGGHTRVVEDIVTALPDYKHTLVLTDVMNNYSAGRLGLGLLEKRFADMGVRVIFLREPLQLPRMQELDRLIERVAPATVILNAHHFDAVTYGVVCAATAPRVLFLHHCDYEPSLGATREDYVHVDLTFKCHEHCKAHGFTKPSMLPMSSKDFGTADIDWSAPLTGLTSGTHIKYVGTSGFNYAELLVALFRAGLSTMHHIGFLPPPMLEEILQAIRAAGEDAAKLRYHGTVPSLAQTMLELRPHFYMTSHPRGGLKAALEAVSVGLPIIQSETQGEASLFVLPADVGDIASFRSLQEIEPVLSRVRNDGAVWGKANRQNYERTFAPSLFRERLLSYIAPVAPQDFADAQTSLRESA